MNVPTQYQLKDRLMKDILSYIDEVWKGNDDVTGILFDETKTFCDNITPAFFEKCEGNVLSNSDRAKTPHSYGVLWAVEDLNVIIDENLTDTGKVTLFSRTYSNETDKTIHVTEKLDEALKVMDSVTIGFTEKINAGYETSVTAGVKIGVFNAETTAKFNMGIELGANQSSTKTIEKITTAGFSINFEIPSGKKKTVLITATEKIGNARNDAYFVARGKAYVKVAYNGNSVSDDTHIYILDLDEIAINSPKYQFRYPVSYIVNGIDHTNYNVEIKESTIKSDIEVKSSAVLSYPLEVSTSTLPAKSPII